MHGCDFYWVYFLHNFGTYFCYNILLYLQLILSSNISPPVKYRVNKYTYHNKYIGELRRLLKTFFLFYPCDLIPPKMVFSRNPQMKAHSRAKFVVSGKQRHSPPGLEDSGERGVTKLVFILVKICSLFSSSLLEAAR